MAHGVHEADRSRRWRDLRRALLLAGVYFATGKLGLALASVNPSATAVWAPTGIALASFLLLGYRIWPGILLGAFLANVTTAGTVGTSVGIAFGNTLEGLCGAYLVNRFARGRNAFDRPGDILRFVLLAGLLSTTVSATLGVTTLALRGFASWADYGPIWFTWWLGDVGGDLIVAPLLILWSTRPRPGWSRRYQALEAVSLVATVGIVGGIFLDGLIPVIAGYRLQFVCIPLLIWPAFRFGRRETVTVSFLLSGLAIWGTLKGTGPFLERTQNESLLMLQCFMGTLTFTGLVLAAVVSERRRAQEALTLRADELTRSNTELERFAYIASHDLQEPLRTVTSFVQLLARRYDARLDQDAHDFIRFAVEGTARMSDLIQGVLTYSRAGATVPSVEVDSGIALEKAIANLSVSIQDSGASVTHEAMPTILADDLQMVELFQNLIGNSIKFRSGTRPEVHVKAERDGGSWLFSVRDNGIGISAEHLKRIFLMFQRLHRRDEYPGTGVGLAICEKIVRRHGGRIWVSSEPGKGSTFYFTLSGPPTLRTG